MKINRITTLGRGLYAHVCPLCGKILASACEEMLLPEFSICDCDRREDKQPAYELFEQDGYTMIRRNKPPRFVGRVTFGQDSDIELVEVFDEAGPMEMAAAMRKAGEFLIKSSRRR